MFGDLAGATAVEVRVLPRGTSLEQYQTSRYIPLAKAGTAVVTVVGYDGPSTPPPWPANRPGPPRLDCWPGSGPH